MVKVLCIVQARLTSSRLPNKVLMKLGESGKSILEHVYERLKQSQRIDKIVFAIPDNSLNDDLALFLGKVGIEFYRGDEDDVLARYYKCALLYSPQFIVRATCDNPCVDWELADHLIDNLGDADYVCCEDTALGTSVAVFSMEALQKTYINAKAEEEREHVCPYMIRHPEWFRCKMLPYNHTQYRLTVDERADFDLIDTIYRKLYKGYPIHNKLIYEYLEANLDLLNLNKTVKQKIL